MEKSSWARTMLTVYSYLDRVAGAIDKIVQKRALNSFYYTSATSGYNDIVTVSDDILALTERKVNLINMKVICQKALKKIKPEYAKLLILTFIDKRTTSETAKLLKISNRTYFRKITLALNSFEKEIKNMGYTDEKLDKIYENEGWILEAKNQTDEQEEKQIETVSFKNIYCNFGFTHQIHSSLTF